MVKLKYFVIHILWNLLCLFGIWLSKQSLFTPSSHFSSLSITCSESTNYWHVILIDQWTNFWSNCKYLYLFLLRANIIFFPNSTNRSVHVCAFFLACSLLKPRAVATKSVMLSLKRFTFCLPYPILSLFPTLSMGEIPNREAFSFNVNLLVVEKLYSSSISS